MLIRVQTFFIFICFNLLFIGFCIADDPGIHKTRIFQANDTTYIIDVDVPQKFIWAIKPPIFPDRFKVGPMEYIEQGQWYVARVKVISQGAPLNHKDVIVFPWLRNGADITARWIDGSINKALFIQTTSGIVVPLHMLMNYEVSSAEVFKANFIEGISHILSNGISLFFLVLVFCSFNNPTRNHYLLAYLFGCVIAIVLNDYFKSPVPFLLSILIFLGALLLISNSVLLNNIKSKTSFGILSFSSFLFFFSFVTEITPYYDSQSQLSIAFVGFLCGLLVNALPVVVLLYFSKKTLSKYKKSVVTGLGGCITFLILFIFMKYVQTGETHVINYAPTNRVTTNQLPVDLNAANNVKKTIGKAEMTAPIMSFISISPYELKHEILVETQVALKIIGSESYQDTIPIADQFVICSKMASHFKENSAIKIGKEGLKTDRVAADFVSLSTSGVQYKTNPQVERIETGLIGVSMVYELSAFPDKMELDWSPFMEKANRIEVSSVDPFSNKTVELKKGDALFEWKSVIQGYQEAAIEKIKVDQLGVPIFSYISMLLILFLVGYQYLKNTVAIISLTVITLITFPVLRINMGHFSQISFLEGGTERVLTSMLTNVYKSFDARNENVVYDRLSRTVSGEELANIYLSNRKALEFEERGGARAIVDYVDVKNIHQIQKNGDHIIADVEWKIGGSVDHFGHTHYRQNYYRANITFAVVNNTWKILNIELLEEKRIL